MSNISFSHVKIATYWYEHPDEGAYVVNLAYPGCFACGWAPTGATRWSKACLERAHIIAASMNGPEHISNYVLLCNRCHREAPMTRNPAHMHDWMKRRPYRLRGCGWSETEMVTELEAIGVRLKDFTTEALETARKEMLVALEKIGADDCIAGVHPGVGVTVSSAAYLLRDALVAASSAARISANDILDKNTCRYYNPNA